MDKLELLWEDIKQEYEVGTLEDFSEYLADPEKRKMFYDEVIQGLYDVESQEQFEELYGLGQFASGEKKNPDGTPIVPGGPGDPDSISNSTPVVAGSASPVDPNIQQPSLDGGEENIEDNVIEDDVEEIPEEDVEIINQEEEDDFGYESSNYDNMDLAVKNSGIVRRDGETTGEDYVQRNDQGEISTAMERAFGSNGFTDFFGDMYRGYQTGAAQGDAVGDFMQLALKNAENVTQEDIENFLAAQRRLEEQPESYEMAEFRRISAANGGGFMGMMTGLINNLSIAPAVLVQSIRSMVNAHSLAAAGMGALAGGGAGLALGAAAGAVGGPVGAFFGSIFTGTAGAVGGAIGGATTALEGALSFAEFFKAELEKQGMAMNAESVRELLFQPEAMSRIRNRAISRGLTIGTVEAVTMGLSKGAVGAVARLGTKAASKGLLKGAIKGKNAIQASKMAAIGTGVGIEAVGGSFGEYAGRKVAGQEMDEIDIFLEGIAGISTAPISVTAGLLRVPRYKVNGDFVSQETVDAIFQKVEDGGLTMEELASPELNVEVFNDPARKNIITNAKSYAKLGLELDPNITDTNDRKTAIDLEYAKRAIKNPDLETSKIKIKQIDKYLKAISDKYNGNLNEQATQELIGEGVESPSDQQIQEKANAIFERITKTLDAQKLAPNSKTLGTRDESDETTTEQSPAQTENETETTKTKKTKVTDQQANEALAEDGITEPTVEETNNKRNELQAEIDKLAEAESTETDSLQRNEAVETDTTTKDGSKIKVKVEQVLSNLQNFQGGKIVGEVATKAYNKLVNIAKRGAASISKVLPNTKIILVEDPATYKLLTGKENPGAYMSQNDTIYINTSKANIATIGHEIGHALLIQGLKKGESNLTAVTTRLVESLKDSKSLDKIMLTFKNAKGKVQRQTLAEYLNDFASNYSENLQSEEKITELIGTLAGNFGRLDIKQKGIVRRFLDKIMKGIGLGKYVNELTSTDRKVVSFLNAMAGKIGSGSVMQKGDMSLLNELQAEQDAINKLKPKKKPKKKPKAKKKAKKKVSDKADVKIKPKKKPKAKTPKKGDQKDSVEEMNDRFQNDYSDPVSGMTFSYDVNSGKFAILEKDKFINREKSIKDFNKQSVLLHQPDGAYSGFILDKKGNVLVEGKGGVFYTIKFHEDGSFWAGSKQGADLMVKLLNEASIANGGKVLMALTSAPADKLLSSTTMANGVIDIFNYMSENTTLKLGKESTQNIVVEAANTQLGTNLEFDNTYESNLSEIKIKLGTTEKTQNLKPDEQDNFISFKKRKAFVSNVIKNISDEINNSPEAIKQFGKIFSEGIQNKYFKGKSKTGKLSISPANMTQALSEMLTEPVLKDDVVESGVNKGKRKTGEIYAILEIDGQVESVKTDQHESYAYGIKAKTKGNKATVNLLTDRVSWTDVTIDPQTSQTIESSREKSVFPSFGTASTVVTLNTDNVTEIQDRDQISLDRLIDDYNVNPRGFMPANIYNLGLLRRQAKEFGLGIAEAKIREGYRRGEISGYYFTKGLNKQGKPKFFNPRARYQIIDSDKAVDIIIDARKNKISDAAIKIALDAEGFKKGDIASALENADFYADISSEVPSSFKVLGDKKGAKLYNKVVDFVKKKNIENSKPNKRKSTKELAINAEDRRAAYVKQANLKTNVEIEAEVSKERTRLSNLKKPLSATEIDQRANKKLFALQKAHQDKLNRINNSMLKFEQQQTRKNDLLDPKLSRAEVIDLAIEVLQADPTYIDAIGKKEGQSDLQILLVDQLLSNLATRATVNVNQKIKAAKARLNLKFKGNPVLTKKEVFYTQTQLINLVKQTIPAALFDSAAVQNLLKDIRDVAKPGRDINDITKEITRKINTINSKFLFKQIESILNKKYTRKSGGVVKALKVIGDISTRIKNIVNNTLVNENSKLELSELKEKVTDTNAALQEKLNKLGKELKTTPESQEKLIAEMADIQIAMQINNALAMDNNNSSKVGQLNLVLESLEEMLLGGESALKLKLKQQQQQHMDIVNSMYEAITGKKLDLSVNDNLKLANKAISDAKKVTERKQKRFFIISRVYTAIAKGISYLRNSTSGLALLVEKLDVLPGELFGGVMQELVYEKINESSYAYKQFQQDNKKIILDKVVELFVTKKFLGITKPNFVQRKQARKALRKMNEVTGRKKLADTRLGRMMKKAGVEEIYKLFSNIGRLDADGNSIYTSQKEIELALKEVENATGIFEKLRAKKDLRNAIYANQFTLSDAETYYLYNQYKDESNHVNFAMNPLFGKDHARIMQKLTESMTPELKAYADWQVNEMYPSLYERYNEVYKKIYHIDLPWNDTYGGRLYLEGIENDAVSLIGNPNIYKTGDTKSASMFSRVQHNNPIQITNGNNALSTYLTDMDWFAAYGENINNISKAFGNATIKGAITAKEGDFFYETIDKIVNTISARGINSSMTNKLISVANNFFISTRIALTPIIAAKQLLSTFTYVGDIGFVNWFKYAGLMTANSVSFGKFGQGFAGAAKEIFANSPYMKDRYSAGFQNTLEAYSNTKETTLLPGGYMQFIMDFNMFFSKVGDAGAIFMGGVPTYLYYKAEAKKTNPDATDQELIDIAIKKFQKSTKETQQSSDIQDKDIYQMGDSSLRYLNMFKTTPKQYMRKSMYSQIQMGRKVRAGFKAMFQGKSPVEIYKTIRDTGKGSFLQNLRNFMLYYTVMPVTFQYMAMGLPGLMKDDGLDDEDINDLVRSAALGNIGAMFIVGDLVKGVSDFYIGDKAYAEDIGQGLPIFELASQFNKKYARYERLKPGPLKEAALLQLLGTGLDLGGLPGSKGMQGVQHVLRLNDGSAMTDEERVMRYLGYSEYIISKANKADEDAIPEGLSPNEVKAFLKKKNKNDTGSMSPAEYREFQKKNNPKRAMSPAEYRKSKKKNN